MQIIVMHQINALNAGISVDGFKVHNCGSSTRTKLHNINKYAPFSVERMSRLIHFFQ